MKLLSHVWLMATPWTAAYQAPASMGFSRQEYWSGVPSRSPKYPLIITSPISIPILISFLSPHLFYLQRTYQSLPGILVHICMWCVLFLPCWNVSSIYHDLSSLLLHSQLKCLISHRCLIVVHEWMQIKARSFQKKNSIMETPFSED